MATRRASVGVSPVASPESSGKRGRSSSEKRPAASEQQLDEDEYEVESILEEKGAKYLVKWLGWEKPTWEAKADCAGCEEKIAEFKARKKPKVAPAKKKKPAFAKKPAKKKSPAAAPKAAAPAKKPAAVSAGEAAAFVVAFKITGSITEWDDNTFTDCNRDEYEESYDEHVRLSKAHDESGREQLPLGSLASANEAAKAKLKELVHSLHVSVKEDRFEDEEGSVVEEQARAAAEAAAASTPAVGAGGEHTLEATVKGEVDAYGADLHNECTYTVRVVVKAAAAAPARAKPAAAAAAHPKPKPKPRAAVRGNGPIQVNVTGGEGNKAHRTGSTCTLTLLPGMGLADLKKMIKRAFGKKKYHQLGSLILCDAEGSPTQPNRAVKAKDLVDGVTVRCTYTYASGNGNLWGGRGGGRRMMFFRPW